MCECASVHGRAEIRGLLTRVCARCVAVITRFMRMKRKAAAAPAVSTPATAATTTTGDVPDVAAPSSVVKVRVCMCMCGCTRVCGRATTLYARHPPLSSLSSVGPSGLGVGRHGAGVGCTTGSQHSDESHLLHPPVSVCVCLCLCMCVRCNWHACLCQVCYLRRGRACHWRTGRHR